MARELQLVLSDAAYRRVEAMRETLHEASTEGVVFQALGLLQLMLDEYVNDQGVLIVVNRRLKKSPAPEEYVELEFEKMRSVTDSVT